jgi:hypothetical protein
MYELWDLKEYACKHTSMYFLADLHNVGQLTDFFILSYWIVVILGVISMLCGLYELAKILKYENYVPISFGDRNYEYIPTSYRRSARVVGRVLDIKISFMVIYGLTTFMPSYILPWLFVYSIVIPLEIIHWISDAFIRLKYDSSQVYKLVFLALKSALTVHLYIAMNSFNQQ